MMKWIRILVIVSLVVAAVIVFSVSAQNRVSATAQTIMGSCINSLVQIETCYSEEFFELSKKNDLDFVISVLKELNNLDPKSNNCHVAAHYIALAEVKKNPSKWMELLEKDDISFCSGGFIHGILEVHQQLDPDFSLTERYLNKACSKVKNELENKGGEENCNHIMGHLVLAEVKGDIKKAVKLCSKTSRKFQFECYAGVFMESETRENLIVHQGFSPLEWNEENIKRQEEICNKYDEIASEACWRELAHMYAGQNVDSPLQIYNFCERAGDRKKIDLCYLHAIKVFSPTLSQSNLNHTCVPYADISETYRYCIRLTVYYLMTSSSAPLIEKGINFCTAVDQPGYCFTQLGGNFRIILNEKDRIKACSKVSQKYRFTCLNGKNSGSYRGTGV